LCAKSTNRSEKVYKHCGKVIVSGGKQCGVILHKYSLLKISAYQTSEHIFVPLLQEGQHQEQNNRSVEKAKKVKNRAEVANISNPKDLAVKWT
jgi:hypothetical protein